ncbi:MAG: M23 family metallopeptidase [Vicinamibacterales bacterium]
MGWTCLHVRSCCSRAGARAASPLPRPRLIPRGSRAARRFAVAVIALVTIVGLVVPSAEAQAQRLDVALEPASPRAGDVVSVLVAAPPATTGVDVRAFDHQWPVVRVDEVTWRGLVGIDLDRAAGVYDLTVETTGSDSPLVHEDVLRVARRDFPRRVLKVAPQYVNPSPDLLARITREAAFLRDVFTMSDGKAAWANGLRRPVDARANSSFGTRSVFNGEPRSPHTGTDFLSGAGTPIHAPAGGRIVAARDLFFSGNTVVIDHGLGLFSTLAHLSRIDVREGTTIERGEIVGLVGATGRVTGPHLHWALRLDAARVDPLAALAVLPMQP